MLCSWCCIYSDSKDLAKRIVSDRILKDRVYKIAESLNYDGYQRVLTRFVYTFFDKKTGSGASANEVLAKELHKPVLKIFKRRKIYI